MPDAIKLCECGCGQPAPLATSTDRKRGRVKGQPNRFVHGHHNHGARHPQWAGDNASRASIHRYLARHFPKGGKCDECGAAGRTEYALITGRSYSKSREDYRELCYGCHRAYDDHLLPRGEANGSAKLTEAAVREIRRRYTEGETSATLSQMYGVARRTIWTIVTGRAWRHIETR